MTMPMLAGVVLGENTTSENVNKVKKLVEITLLRQQMLKEQVSTLPLHSSEQVGDEPVAICPRAILKRAHKVRQCTTRQHTDSFKRFLHRFLFSCIRCPCKSRISDLENRGATRSATYPDCNFPIQNGAVAQVKKVSYKHNVMQKSIG